MEDCKFGDLPNRIKEIRSVLCQGDNGIFAEKLGKSKQYTSSLCNGNESIGKKITEQILDAFPEVNRAWFILGEGNMLVEPNKETNIEANGRSVVNSISHTGSSCNNTINDANVNERLMEMYEARLVDKDSVIDTLRETIHTLQGEVEQLRAYVKLTSTKYIEEIERMRNITSDTHDMVKEATSRIGFNINQEG